MNRGFRHHRLSEACLAVLMAVAGLGTVVRPVAAAAPALTIVTTSTYDVRPAEHRVAVTVAITATSNLRDTTTRRYFTDRGFLALLPNATNLRVTGGPGKPAVSVSSRSASNLILLITFGTQLGAGKSIGLTLTFDIVDPGGAPSRALRISPSLVSFQAWAFGTDGVGGSSVRVQFPAEYVAAVGRGPLSGPSTNPDGLVVYASGSLATPNTFVADLMADRPGVLLDGRSSISVGGETLDLLVRSWPDDPDWRAEVTKLLTRGIPALGSSIGLGWSLGPTLEVRETIARSAGAGTSTGGEGAGAFDAAIGRLDIPYTADPAAILHGAAHAWFNATLVADRWISEGFTSLYAARAATDIGVKIGSPAMIDGALAHLVPLNGWVVGGVDDAFGYAASLELARDVAAGMGDGPLQAVWRDAAAGIGAYQPAATSREGPPASPERLVGAVDWRSFLDLLEEHAGRSFEGLWRARVVRATDSTLLDARSGARALYDATAAAAAPWVLPRSIRDAMRAWRFDDATTQLYSLMTVLEQRRDIALAAATNGLKPPETLHTAFEGTGGVLVAAAEAVTEQAVIDAFNRVVEGQPVDPDLLTRIGLIGVDPQAEIVAARTAFAAGDLDATARHADGARAMWANAPEVGRGRVVSGATLVFAFAVLLWLLISRRRHRGPRFGWSASASERPPRRGAR